MTRALHIVGGGMAGSEAAWQAACLGIPVVIHEMRPKVGTFAHRTGNLAEMVCSNSFRSDDDEQNAVGLLHWEMRAAGGLIMEMADRHRLPAGGALAVDRDPFAEAVTERLKSHPNITVEDTEITELPDDGHWIIATGPLTSGALAEPSRGRPGRTASPSSTPSRPSSMPTASTCRWPGNSRATTRARPRRSAPPIINCPMTATSTRPSSTRCSPPTRPSSNPGETASYFDGCLPIEVMAERGRETLRHGPMKPVGLTNPHKPEKKPYAVVQLRRDNKLGTLYNIVGFQTKMKYGAQTDVFRMIPGLQDAAFARLGGIHRNTFINSPRCWTKRCACAPARISASPARSPASRAMSKAPPWGFWPGAWPRPRSWARPCPRAPHHRHGRADHHITGGAEAKTFQPMNVNFGLFPPLDGSKAAARAARPLQGLHRPGQGRLDRAGWGGHARRRRMIWTAGGRPR
jgi:methylenetetrahydrofolate--tRNA-(uracil-5-)-methyltransferase